MLKHRVPVRPGGLLCTVRKNGIQVQAEILRSRPGEFYVHYANTDKRLDEWVPEDLVQQVSEDQQSNGNDTSVPRKKRRTSRSPSPKPGQGENAEEEVIMMTEEEYDIQHHKQITAQRNFEKVIFSPWSIKTWYYSPYPLSDSEIDEASSQAPISSSNTAASQNHIPGVARTSVRSHGRTSDILATGLARSSSGLMERSTLWVCDRCLKYMVDSVTWDVHLKRCEMKRPPGKKVYENGAQRIFEVDGSKEKLYCQNLSLFGKLFIDVKTLFFDCDNFLYYVLTEANTTSKDDIVGFFSKEKVSYDDYNLATIITLPPYQQQGYGKLMIEFSYELSRRAGVVGTPERPLSDLGLRSYLAFWINTLIRFLRRLLSVVPIESGELSTDGSQVHHLPKLLSTGSPPGEINTNVLSVNASPSPNARAKFRKRSRSQVEVDLNGSDPTIAIAPLQYLEDPLYCNRKIETTPNVDGTATSHVVVRCTLADIARAANLRVEDAAFALNECGLLNRKKPIRRDPDDENADGEAANEDGVGSNGVGEELCVSREMVEKVARERSVKRMLLNLDCVLV